MQESNRAKVLPAHILSFDIPTRAAITQNDEFVSIFRYQKNCTELKRDPSRFGPIS